MKTEALRRIGLYRDKIRAAAALRKYRILFGCAGAGVVVLAAIAIGIGMRGKEPAGSGMGGHGAWDRALSDMRDGDLERALTGFEEAAAGESPSSLLYRDYAIALILSGKEDDAEVCVAGADDSGWGSDTKYLLKAGIQAERGDSEEAQSNLELCLRLAKEPLIRYYAYVFYSGIYSTEAARLSNSEEKTAEILKRKQSLWEEAMGNVGEEYQPYACRAALDTTLELYDLTEERSYLEEALAWSGQLEEMRGDTYATCISRAGILEGLGRYEEARAALQSTVARYGNQRRACGLLAILEAECQNEADRELRDYSTFLELYHKAEALYEKEMSGNEEDVVKNRLEDIYAQVCQGGWVIY